MENLAHRLEGLEAEMRNLRTETLAIERRWRARCAIAWVVSLLALALFGHSFTTGARAQGGGLHAIESRVSALESRFQHFSRSGNELFITGANLHIVSGLGATNGFPSSPDTLHPEFTRVNGMGNLVVGRYRGSHNQAQAYVSSVTGGESTRRGVSVVRSVGARPTRPAAP